MASSYGQVRFSGSKRLRYGPPEPSCGIVCHNQKDEATFRDIVKEVILPNVGKLAVVRGDLGQDRLRRY
jgi:hypothetical protein